MRHSFEGRHVALLVESPRRPGEVSRSHRDVELLAVLIQKPHGYTIANLVRYSADGISIRQFAQLEKRIPFFTDVDEHRCSAEHSFHYAFHAPSDLEVDARALSLGGSASGGRRNVPSQSTERASPCEAQAARFTPVKVEIAWLSCNEVQASHPREREICCNRGESQNEGAIPPAAQPRQKQRRSRVCGESHALCGPWLSKDGRTSNA
mmetsp:Transcript_78796/g.219027  ORF Transcript_78796/g.219027 Transcript_78796/m.219027 type:complete len:208 (-) Transcript_78796:2-625(-)